MAIPFLKICFPLVVALSLVTGLFPVGVGGQLVPDFYEKSCPAVGSIVRQGAIAAFMNESRMAATLLRLHFHDCIVNGCDASVLLDDVAGEKSSFANKNSARGFEIIDAIKERVEEACPLTVSCADILTLVAKEAVVWAGGPNWIVALGRRDGLTSSQDDANNQIPSPFDTLENNVLKFTAKGLQFKDLVVLLGAHTIGFSQCKNFKDRLYNFNQTGKPDPTINRGFLKVLRVACPNAISSDPSLFPLDPSSSDQFDNKFYTNLVQNSSVLGSDQALMGDPAGASMVRSYVSNPDLFSDDFAESIVKLGNLGVLTGEEGEIRENCRLVN